MRVRLKCHPFWKLPAQAPAPGVTSVQFSGTTLCAVAQGPPDPNTGGYRSKVVFVCVTHEGLAEDRHCDLGLLLASGNNKGCAVLSGF